MGAVNKDSGLGGSGSNVVRDDSDVLRQKWAKGGDEGTNVNDHASTRPQNAVTFSL